MRILSRKVSKWPGIAHSDTLRTFGDVDRLLTTVYWYFISIQGEWFWWWAFWRQITSRNILSRVASSLVTILSWLFFGGKKTVLDCGTDQHKAARVLRGEIAGAGFTAAGIAFPPRERGLLAHRKVCARALVFRQKMWKKWSADTLFGCSVRLECWHVTKVFSR